MADLVSHLTRQMVFSKATFGPGTRQKGVIDHIKKELAEVETASDHSAAVLEWVDVVILALDGLTREIWAGGEYTADAHYAAQMAAEAILFKQSRNEKRDWPDWRNADPNKAIEHARGRHD